MTTERPGTALCVAFRGGPHGLGQLRDAVSTAVAPCALGSRCVYAIEIVVEEWLTNVERHGGVDLATNPVQFELRVHADRIELRFDDVGAPFDPRTWPAPVQPMSIDAAVPGGLGIALMRSVARALAYKRAAGHNLLTATIERS